MGRPLSIEEAKRILDEADLLVWILNRLLVATMARPSAVLQLEWEQFDWRVGCSMRAFTPNAQLPSKNRRITCPDFPLVETA